MRFLAIIVALGAALLASGCASDSAAGKGASQGASLGMVGGAVAGAVGSLLWGGNPVEGAVKGGMVGAASGAATGAMAGSQRDRAAKEQSAARPPANDFDANQAELRKRIGDRNYATAVLLTQCRHKEAIASSEETLTVTKDPQERQYAWLIQSVAAEESGDKALAGSLYPKMAKEDPARGSAEKRRADALEGVMKVQAARKAHGLPPLCS
jgi:hypothetical protein